MDFLYTREQTVPLVVGLVVMGLAALVVADVIWWRRRGTRYAAKIVGILDEGAADRPLYRAVVEFQTPGGDPLTIQGKADDASSNLTQLAIGKPVSILFAPASYPEVRVEWGGRIKSGLVVCGLGAVVAAFSLHAMQQTWLAAAITVFYVGLLFFQLFANNKEQRVVAEPQDFSGLFVSERTLDERVRKIGGFNQAATPVAFVGVVALVALSCWLTYQVLELHLIGRPAQGEIVGYESKSNSKGSPSQFARVTFTPAGGSPITFTDRFGSSSPTLATGQVVDVLYDPSAPAEAQVDLGLAGNFALPAGVLLVAFLLLRMGVVALTTIRQGKQGIRWAG